MGPPHTQNSDIGSAALMKSSQPSSLFLMGWGDGKRDIVYLTALKGLNPAGFEFWDTSSPLLPSVFTHILSPFLSKTLQPSHLSLHHGSAGFNDGKFATSEGFSWHR